MHMIHALPGMGADHRMFPEPWGDLPGFAAHDWPKYKGERTLEAVARKVCDTCGIRDGDTVIGASLGGMIACEIAKLRHLHAVYLIGSATRRDEVNRFLLMLRPLIGLTPFAAKMPSDLAQMFATVEAGFVRSMCRAIFDWDGLGTAPVRCIRIHGRRDHIIPAPEKSDLLVDGGHLISMTHAHECVDFVRKGG
jgi:pimeloyl-ACP methyl ester carboxylesterase